MTLLAIANQSRLVFSLILRRYNNNLATLLMLRWTSLNIIQLEISLHPLPDIWAASLICSIFACWLKERYETAWHAISSMNYSCKQFSRTRTTKIGPEPSSGSKFIQATQSNSVSSLAVTKQNIGCIDIFAGRGLLWRFDVTAASQMYFLTNRRIYIAVGSRRLLSGEY